MNRIQRLSFYLLSVLAIIITPIVVEGQEPSSSEARLAVYRWGAGNPKGGARAVEQFARWSQTPGLWAVDFEAFDRWGNNIAGGSWQLGEWSAWKRHAPAQRRLILSVPLLPGRWDRSGSIAPGETGPVSLAAGAKGEYNRWFSQLAEALVQYELGDTILRLGWEMNGGWYTWRAAGEEDNFAEYFRQIVQTMRAVKGAENLKFCWNPALGWQQFPAEKCYPGDKYVDYIGLDVYDESWGQNTYPLDDSMSETEQNERRDRAWNQSIYGGNHGIKWYIDFAKARRKPLCFPEWGVSKREDAHGGLDNPRFIERMYEVISNPDNNIAWHGYFDVAAPDGNHQLSPGLDNVQTIFPKSAETFRKLFTHF